VLRIIGFFPVRSDVVMAAVEGDLLFIRHGLGGATPLLKKVGTVASVHVVAKAYFLRATETVNYARDVKPPPS